MSGAPNLHTVEISAHRPEPDASSDLAPRRPATVQAIDARLSVWGQAAREGVGRRAKVVAEGSAIYVEHVGRQAEIIRTVPVDHGLALLSTEIDVLVLVATAFLPASVKSSCRLLWVDPERLRNNMEIALQEASDAARAEIRRRQALYRRRARLWQGDIDRLNGLREEVESLRVPRAPAESSMLVARGLLLRHREDADLGYAPATTPREGHRLNVRAGSITRWIDQMDQDLARA
ncbi:MAG: hypothetical protein AAFN74_04295 [Myxococcota bacterium]